MAAKLSRTLEHLLTLAFNMVSSFQVSEQAGCVQVKQQTQLNYKPKVRKVKRNSFASEVKGEEFTIPLLGKEKAPAASC